jgi:hypothetical protein
VSTFVPIALRCDGCAKVEQLMGRRRATTTGVFIDVQRPAGWRVVSDSGLDACSDACHAAIIEGEARGRKP